MPLSSGAPEMFPSPALELPAAAGAVSAPPVPPLAATGPAPAAPAATPVNGGSVDGSDFAASLLQPWVASSVAAVATSNDAETRGRRNEREGKEVSMVRSPAAGRIRSTPRTIPKVPKLLAYRSAKITTAPTQSAQKSDLAAF